MESVKLFSFLTKTTDSFFSTPVYIGVKELTCTSIFHGLYIKLLPATIHVHRQSASSLLPLTYRQFLGPTQLSIRRPG